MVGLGNNLNELKIRIQQIRQDLDSLGEPNFPLEQMIGTTNVLRQNEYLVHADAKKTELISVYAEYTKHLEQITSSLFSIQTDLKELLKTEISLLESEKPKKTVKKSKKT